MADPPDDGPSTSDAPNRKVERTVNPKVVDDNPSAPIPKDVWWKSGTAKNGWALKFPEVEQWPKEEWWYRMTHDEFLRECSMFIKECFLLALDKGNPAAQKALELRLPQEASAFIFENPGCCGCQSPSFLCGCANIYYGPVSSAGAGQGLGTMQLSKRTANDMLDSEWSPWAMNKKLLYKEKKEECEAESCKNPSLEPMVELTRHHLPTGRDEFAILQIVTNTDKVEQGILFALHANQIHATPSSCCSKPCQNSPLTCLCNFVLCGCFGSPAELTEKNSQA